MGTNRFSVIAVVSLVVFMFTTSSFAVDRIWNMRYTYGPDGRESPKIAAGFGLQSNFNDQVLFPINIMGQVAKDWDLGLKVDLFSYNRLSNMVASIDFGGRYRIGTSGFIELDGYFGLNRNDRTAVILTYGKEHYIAKVFSNYYEARVGVLDGVDKGDGWAQMEIATQPTLHFGKYFLLMVEVTASSTIRHPIRDFMADIIPKAEIAVGATRVRLDFDIGILKEDNNKSKKVSLYALQAF
ncbi:MAG: hypothetical protein HUK19_00195 [Fibrobacter sp.]|nr:hypothetical protein [Fibrobacter sp.]